MKTLAVRLPLAVLVVGTCGSMVPVGRAIADAAGPCSRTADAIRESCRADATNGFWLAKARCENPPTRDAVRTCRQQAKSEKMEAKAACADQHTARLRVCTDIGAGAYRPVIDPARFVSRVDNPYFPLPPGTTFVFESAAEHDEVFVTHTTKEILGVSCIVVRDVVRLRSNGEVVEDTLDYFAQDVAGNVWYFGEEAKQLDRGELIGIDGSWKAGRDGAQPGIVMQGTRVVGDVYRQEYAPGEAEDLARVVSLSESVSVPYGSFTNVLKTDDFSPLDDAVEQKFYAAGVGTVLETSADGERLELVNVTME